MEIPVNFMLPSGTILNTNEAPTSGTTPRSSTLISKMSSTEQSAPQRTG